MKRVRKMCMSALLVVACAGGLTAQDSLVLSNFSCSFAGGSGCGSHCVALCRKQVSDIQAKALFVRLYSSRLPKATVKAESLCICKMLKLASYSKRSTLKCVTAVSLGYHLKSHAAPFGSLLMTSGFSGLAYHDTSSVRSYKKR